MLTLRDPLSEVRAACTRNNFDWLRSFGCRIEPCGPWWMVAHDDLPEYRALVVLQEAPSASAREFAAAADQAIRDDAAVYLDTGSSPDWEYILSGRGYTVTLQSCVRIATARDRPPELMPLTIRRIGMSEVDMWTALYRQVFDRPASLARAEVRRWKTAFAKEGLQHYLFEWGGAPAGFCELCIDDSVAGLYSVGFLRGQRNPHLLRMAVRLALNAVRAQGLQLVYFERARRLPVRPDPTPASRRVVRLFDAWTRVA